MTVLWTVLGLSALIILHELGHYGVAKLFGMRVLRFSIGFGPTLLQKQIGETTWQVAAVPLGGYVQIFGMQADEDATAHDPRSFRSRPNWQRALVVFAGPFTNWLLAALFATFLAWTVGLLHYNENDPLLGEIQPDGAAATAGLLPNDRITQIDDIAITSWSQLVEHIRANPNKPLTFTILRDATEQHVKVTPRAGDGGIGLIGISPQATYVRYGPVAGIGAGVRSAWGATAQQTSLLWGIVRGKKAGQFSGLPGIVKMVAKEARAGLHRLLDALGWLSIGLCILNLLPIPALDGSRLVFLGIEGIRRRPVDPKLEGTIHAIGFILLMMLMVWVSVRDVM